MEPSVSSVTLISLGFYQVILIISKDENSEFKKNISDFVHIKVRILSFLGFKERKILRII
jgi:hypothetical protein